MGSSAPPMPGGRSSCVYSSRTGSPERVRNCESAEAPASARVVSRTAMSRFMLAAAVASRVSMERELAALVGVEHVFAPAESSPYNADATRRRGIVGRADADVLPGSAEEVSAVLAWCYTHDVPLVPRGGGTGLTGGAVTSE